MVCEGVMAGAISSTTVGEMSGMFFVVTRRRSYFSPVWEMLGMVFVTGIFVSDGYDGGKRLTVCGFPSFDMTVVD